MCLATAYIEQGNKKKEVMREVTSIEFAQDRLSLTTLLGERKILKSKIKSIDFANASIGLEEEKSGKGEVEVFLDGDKISLNPFVSRILKGTIDGFLSNLKGFKKGDIEIKIRI